MSTATASSAARAWKNCAMSARPERRAHTAELDLDHQMLCLFARWGCGELRLTVLVNLRSEREPTLGRQAAHLVQHIGDIGERVGRVVLYDHGPRVLIFHDWESSMRTAALLPGWTYG